MLKVKRAHCIGIGGIGVSAIARLLLLEGAEVSGSDTSRSEIIAELESLGAKFNLGHGADNIPSVCDLVVYTNALSKDNPELAEAKKRGIRTISYPEVLGEISRGQYVIAVSGNAGKTTTTAMIGQILIDAGLEPTVVVGSLANFTDRDGNTTKTNFVSGSGKYFVVEADEYKKAFLNLEPQILAITNIEEDHLDYYKNLADIQEVFAELANKVPEDGFIICSIKDKNVSPVLSATRAKIIDYTETSISGYEVPLPGEHNRQNARIAIAVADILNIKREVVERALFDFKSPWRRFEYKGKTRSGALLYDDYAHNPHKIKAVIAGTREKFPDKKIVIIFQPHLFSRTKHLLSQLAESFSGADRVIVTPIYAARELVDLSITHRALASAIAVFDMVQVETIDSLDEIVPLLKSESGETVCLTVGAGDIYTVSRLLLDK